VQLVSLSFADGIKFTMSAARWPARSEPANSQLDLPMAISRI
jgi:hypothetical protein